VITKCHCGAYSLLTATGLRYEENAWAICRHTPRACVWFSPLPTPAAPSEPSPGSAQECPACDGDRVVGLLLNQCINCRGTGKRGST
jgi:hypothetical protein